MFSANVVIASASDVGMKVIGQLIAKQLRIGR